VGIPQSPTPLILRFRTAAILCALFVIIGAVISGADASHGLGKLMGVFVDSSPLQEIQIGELFALSGPQRLFLWSGITIGAGVFFSRPVMTTISKGIVPIGPLGGWL